MDSIDSGKVEDKINGGDNMKQKLPRGMSFSNKDLRHIASNPRGYGKDLSMDAKFILKNRVKTGKAKYITKKKLSDGFGIDIKGL